MRERGYLNCMKAIQRFNVGDRVVDRDGFKWSIRRVCHNGEDSLWYEVSRGAGSLTVRYDSDLTRANKEMK